MLLCKIYCAVVQTHQTRRHPVISAAEPGPVAKVLTQREPTHTGQTLCRGIHRDDRSQRMDQLIHGGVFFVFFKQLQSVSMNF